MLYTVDDTDFGTTPYVTGRAHTITTACARCVRAERPEAVRCRETMVTNEAKQDRPLTKTDVDRAEGPKVKTEADLKRSTWYPDRGARGVSGFGVRVYGTGRKVFQLRYRTKAGRQRALKVADVGDLTVQQAREKAQEEKARVLDGEDPQKERQAARHQTRGKLSTVGELVENWHEDFARPHRRSSDVDAYRVAKIKDALGSLHLVDVTVEELASWHIKLGKSAPVEANRTLETLRAAWRWAEDMEKLPPEASDSSMFRGGRRAKIKRFPEKSRDRWLREHETKRLMKAVEGEDDPYIRAAVPLLLLTGLRKRELLTARWTDLDLERGEIRLRKTKTGEPQTRLLPAPAVAILRSLPRFEESPFVFPSPKDPTEPRDDIKRPWQRIRAAAEIEDVTLHDLRRTAGSYMAQSGVPLEAIQKVLGHSHPGVTKVYARLSSETERDALKVLSAKLDGLLGLAASPKAEERRAALPDRLRALLADVGDDPEALVEGLRGLVTWEGAAEA